MSPTKPWLKSWRKPSSSRRQGNSMDSPPSSDKSRGKRCFQKTQTTSSNTKGQALSHTKTKSVAPSCINLKKLRRGNGNCGLATVCSDLKYQCQESWGALASDVIFNIGQWLLPEDILSIRLVNKHWSVAGHSFITSVRINTKEDFDSPSELHASLLKFSSSTFSHLRSLKISSQFTKGYETLSFLTKLTSLNVSWCHADTHQLAGIEYLRNLTSLSLSWTQLKDEGMQYLNGLTNLVTLRLDWCHITEASIPCLSNLQNLSELSLVGLVAESNDCLQPLRRLKNMVCLDFSWISLSDEAISPLEDLTNLTDLNLTMNKITSQALEKISGLWRLKKLGLSRTEVGNEGLKNLNSLHHLKVLDLSGTRVDDHGLRFLTNLRFLSSLDLSDNYLVGWNNLEHLMPLTSFRFLRRMNLQRTQANGIGVEMFTNAVKPRDLLIEY